MADDTTTAERTEPASGKRMQDARDRGQVARSMEVNTAVVLLFGLLVLSLAGGSMATQIAAIARSAFRDAAHIDLNAEQAHALLSDSIVNSLLILAPFVLAVMIAGLAASFGQVGFQFSMKPLEFKPEKFDPLKGIKKVVGSRRMYVELLKGFLKLVIVALVAYASLEGIVRESVSLIDSGVGEIFTFMVDHALAVGGKIGLVLLFLAAVDYFFQRHEHQRELKMTKQEVKEETKMLEGDPLIKSRVRGIQRQIAYRRMMQDVPKADVVVVNPTHFSVALKYESGRMPAPKVLAKGADHIAHRIKSIALEHHIPVVEDKPLARALYASVDVGEFVPEKLFQAVAQVLAYIYKMRMLRTGPVSVRA